MVRLSWRGIRRIYDDSSSEFKSRFKVLVQDTTEDFLYPEALKTFGHYKYTLGLETRGDLARSGGHCWEGDIESGRAIDWLLGNIELPEDPLGPHFKRVSTLDYIRGMTLDSNGVLWVVRQPPDSGDEATLWRSVDRGTSWETVSRVGLRVTDLDAVQDKLFLGAESGLYQSVDRGVSFQRVLPNSVNRIVTDLSNSLYLSSRNGEGAYDLYSSQDLGQTWFVWSSDTGPLQRDPILVSESPQIIAGNAIRAIEDGGWIPFSNSAPGSVHSAAWDGSTLWGLNGQGLGSGKLLRSVNKGAFWTEAELPAEIATLHAISSQTSISALGRDRLLIYQFNLGGSFTSYPPALMSADLGQEWISLLGGPRSNAGFRGQQWIAAHPQVDDVFVTSGTGIFSVDAQHRNNGLIVGLVPSGDAMADSDGDGVIDAKDAFPTDGSEYLDTDGDGTGNNRDSDDDGDGIDDAGDGAPLDRFDSVDTDGDGIGNDTDPDDDGDRVEDVIDAFSLDGREWADADYDGIGDNADLDDDGDGVDDIADVFPGNAREWLDTDGDGIGNNLDRDDDNDGLRDHIDSDPLSGAKTDHLGIAVPSFGIVGIFANPSVRHERKPGDYSYPDPKGDCPVYGFFRLGNGATQEIQWMMDVPGCGYGSRTRIFYLDRNGNGNLTDDGPPMYLGDRSPPTQVDLQYASGAIFPYFVSIAFDPTSIEPSVFSGSFWTGEVEAPGGPVSVWTVDQNSDGVFQTFTPDGGDGSEDDFLCIDLNRDLRADCLPDHEGAVGAERISPDERFILDGQHFRASIPPSGHKVDLVKFESFEIPNLGGWSTTSSGTERITQVGYGRIAADAGSTTPSGIAIIGYSPGGTLISEAGVPASEPVREGRIFAEVNGPVNTGLAIANPNDAPATINFYFTDADGVRFAEGAYVLDAGRQISRFLNETPFNGEDEEVGTFTFTSSLPIAVIALRGFTNRDGEFLMTTLPVAPLASGLTDTVYFPHFADGSGWATQVILVNPTVRTITGTVQFLGQGSRTTAAAPAVRTLEDGRTGSSFEYSIPPNGSYRIITSNPPGGVSVGSVRAIPDDGHRAPSGLVIFSFASAGKTVLEAGVPALAAGSAFRVYVESSGTPEQAGSIRTGVAITNAADTANTVTLEVTGLDGTLAAPPGMLTLPPSGQVSRFIDEFFDSLPPDFSGVLRVTSTAEVAIVGLRLRYNDRRELKMTTTPPSIETGASTMADRYFAHIVDSRGWSTQVILFSGTAGQASSGTLSFIGATGEPWDLPSTQP